jgi:hypothetical protein
VTQPEKGWLVVFKEKFKLNLPITQVENNTGFINRGFEKELIVYKGIPCAKPRVNFSSVSTG